MTERTSPVSIRGPGMPSPPVKKSNSATVGDASLSGDTEVGISKGPSSPENTVVHTPSQSSPFKIGLSEEAVHLTELIAKAISARVTGELSSACDAVKQSVELAKRTIGTSSEHEIARQSGNEQQLNELLDRFLGTDKLYKIGIRNTIRVSIGPNNRVRFFDPRPEAYDPEDPSPLQGDLSSVSTMTPLAPTRPNDHRTVIPGRIVQLTHPDEPVVFEPSSEFTEMLKDMVKIAIFCDLEAKGDAVHQTFKQAMALFRKRHNLPSGVEACAFKLAEEDYDFAKPKIGDRIMSVNWPCSSCGGRHLLEVFE